MNRLEQYRQQYPQFKDTSDENLLKIAHSRHYKDMDFEDFKQKALAPVEQTEEARAFTGYLKDVGVGAVRGVTAAAEELGQFASEHFRERDEAQLSLLTRGMSEDDAQQLRQQQRERMGDPLLSGLQDLSLPNIGDPETFPGQATKAVSQFLTGFTATGLGSGKFKNMSNAARYGYTLARGAVTEYAFFDPYDGNFSNFLTEIGVPKNVVSDLLSVDPDDAVGTARAKNAVTGTVLGVVADKFIDGVMSVRRAWSDQSAKRALKEADEKAIDAVSKDPSKDLEEVLEYRDSTREYVPQEFREVEPSDDIVNLMSGRQEGTNEVDRFLGSWKFDNIDAPSEAKAALELGAKEYRLNRKVMSIDETYEAARKMGWSNSDIERLTKEVQDFPALVAYTRDVATTRMNALKEVAQKAEFGGLEDLARFDEEFAKVMMLFDSVTQQASAAGRAVRMYREMAKDRSGHLDELREILKARGGEDKFRDLAKTMSILDDPLEAIKSGRQIYKDPTLMDGVSEWIINQSFLSGPATQVKNIQGNILMNVLNMAERGVAAGVGSVRRKATGASDGVTGKEALAYSAASFRGFVDGGKALVKSFRDDEAIVRVGDRTVIDPVTKLESESRKAISGKMFGRYVPDSVKRTVGEDIGEVLSKSADVAGELVRVSGRTLTAVDSFFKTVAYRQELTALAIRRSEELIKKGDLNPGDVDIFVQKMLASPSRELHEAAMHSSRVLTFTEQLGSFGQHIIKLSNSSPFAKVIIPFVRVSTNLLKQAGHRSSAFALFSPKVRADLRAGGARADLAIARMISGTGAILPAYFLAESGQITGSPPKDPLLRQSFYAAGLQPYSFKHPISGKWVSYEHLDPIASLLAAAANFSQYQSYMTEEELDEYWTNMMAGNMQLLLDKSWHEGLDNFYGFITGDNPDYLEEMAAVATVPNFIAQGSRAFGNNYLNVTEGYLEKVKKRLGDSGDLTVRHDIWGTPIEFEGSWGPDAVDFLNPHFESSPTNSKIKQFVWDKRIRLQPPPKTIDGVKLTPAQHQKFIVEAGRPALERLEEIANSRMWGRLSDGMKEKLIKDTLARYTGLARQKMKIEIREDLVKKKREEVDNLLN